MMNIEETWRELIDAGLTVHEAWLSIDFHYPNEAQIYLSAKVDELVIEIQEYLGT